MDAIRGGKLIKHIRLEKHLTQQQLADQAKISQTVVAKLEGFKYVDILPMEAVVHIAQVLGLSIDVIIQEYELSL
jgi:transcriptional regulator with XRE-family HTH domain